MKAFCRIKEKRGDTCSWCGVNSFCPEKGSEGCSGDHLAPWSSELTGEGQNYRTRKTPASLINTTEQLHWLWITQVQKKSDVLGFSYYPELKCIPKRYQRAPHFHCYLWVRLQGRVTGKASDLSSSASAEENRHTGQYVHAWYSHQCWGQGVCFTECLQTEKHTCT